MNEQNEKQQELFMLQELKSKLDFSKAIDGDTVMQKAESLALSADEKIDVVAKRILNKHRAAFEELAK